MSAARSRSFKPSMTFFVLPTWCGLNHHRATKNLVLSYHQLISKGET
jgi:hypothetical protein